MSNLELVRAPREGARLIDTLTQPCKDLGEHLDLLLFVAREMNQTFTFNGEKTTLILPLPKRDQVTINFGIYPEGFLLEFFSLQAGKIIITYSNTGESNGLLPVTQSFGCALRLDGPVMEYGNALIDQCYRCLNLDYQNAAEGTAQPQRISTLENFLKRIYKNPHILLGVQKRHHDPVYQKLKEQNIQFETEKALSWTERRIKRLQTKTLRKTVIKTKSRAHRIPKILITIPLGVSDLREFITRFKMRPASNVLGLLEFVFINPIRWFFSVVRGNMGYSVALAIYSPFTFFFITQPMNPHAMVAVGKVRSVALETKETLGRFFSPKTPHSSREASAPVDSTAPETLPQELPLTAEHKSNTASWDDRMSGFKALQIAYEGNLELAPRLGRIEQMETQLNWPLLIESAWAEMERYRTHLVQAIALPSNAPATRTYLESEIVAVDLHERYLWDRNIRFILDHPYTMMNDSQEQTQWDFYIGRSFVALEDMTKTLESRSKSGLKRPEGFEKIEKIARDFDREFHATGLTLKERLKKRSLVFKSSDPTQTDTLRTFMKRQWEVLYLQQNRAQEASNNGLQMYIWSVRNTVWILQTLYAAKREELATVTAIQATPTQKAEALRTDRQLESLYHLMVTEFASIRKELEALPNDLEATQRKMLIASIEKSLSEREALLRSFKIL